MGTIVGVILIGYFLFVWCGTFYELGKSNTQRAWDKVVEDQWYSDIADMEEE